MRGCSVVVALMWVGACARQPAIAPASAPPPPAPSLKRPAATLFGQVFDGTFKRQSRFELSDETVYGWRIKLPCTGPTLFRETLTLPGPGDWPFDPAEHREVTLSEDRRRAMTNDYSGCYDGWIQNTWSVAPNDPPGEYVLLVEVEGYEPQTFRGRFLPPAEDEDGVPGAAESLAPVGRVRP